MSASPDDLVRAPTPELIAAIQALVWRALETGMSLAEFRAAFEELRP